MSRERWIAEGMRVLSEDGIAGVRIDRVAGRLGLSKGSFFHHFEGIAAYRRAILERWESGAVRELGDAPAQARLEDLAARVGTLVDLRLEVAIRAWAFQDAEAAAAQERVDVARLSALERVWSRMVDDPVRAHAAALLPHLLMIGASVALPATSRADLEAAFGLLAELIPSVPPGEGR
ncbi:MAG TPA: TetR family transcriptional regulator [Microbacterium sp.]|uniref:TetR/AcrR family transcriptional regulator n=1 Tax=Microbacterium sp. TaxID=51671 RepID=UPI002D02C3F2|nr:TetR family transcriptional regulator [Microbacterium sp.]HWI31522.1 TetR family transcriptional regulator [Microbacterium sp.]